MRPAFPSRTSGLVAVALLALVQLGVLLAPAGTAWAQPLRGQSPGKQQLALHPLGNFSINRYDGLIVTPDQLRVDHVQDFAEIPTTQMQGSVDTNGNGILAEDELATWATPRCQTAAGELEARLDERPVRFALQTARAQTRDGQAGLRTLRLECAFAAPIPPVGVEAQLVFVDRASTEGIAWREISARAEGVSLAASDVPDDSVSNRLLAYPEANLSSPLNQRAANLTIRAGGGGNPTESAPEQPANSVLETVLPRGADRLTVGFMSMISRQDLTLGIGLTAILAAIALGASHAAAPGHGKTIMAAYAAGRSEHSLRAVLTLGATVTVTHTAGVFMLALIVTVGTAVAPESLFPWFAAASGVLVVLVGVTLLVRARSARRHGYGHGHGHGHGHGPEDEGGHDHGHGHSEAGASPSPRSERGSILVMGIAGGMVPSPSAIVVLLGAAALGHAWFGVLLVLAYGAGMALTLMLAGLVIVRLSERIQQWLLLRGRARWVSVVPTVTSLVVIVLGVVITVRGVGGALGTVS